MLSRKSEKSWWISYVISQLSIFSNNFSRNSRKIIFIVFSSKSFNFFLEFSQPFVFFVQTRENWTHDFQEFWKIWLNNTFFQFSEDLFANFRKLSCVRGEAPPPDPHEADPLKMSPPQPKSCSRHWYVISIAEGLWDPGHIKISQLKWSHCKNEESM